jgi:hypothetical protein
MHSVINFNVTVKAYNNIYSENTIFEYNRPEDNTETMFLLRSDFHTFDLLVPKENSQNKGEFNVFLLSLHSNDLELDQISTIDYYNGN